MLILTTAGAAEDTALIMKGRTPQEATAAALQAYDEWSASVDPSNVKAATNAAMRELGNTMQAGNPIRHVD